MFGLLGGLLGGGLRRGIMSRPMAGRPLGGLLANRMMNARRGGGGSSGGAPPSAPPPQEEQQSAPQPQQEAPQPAMQSPQTQEPPPMVQQASQKLEAVEQKTQQATAEPPKPVQQDLPEPKKQEPQNVTAGLLDDAPPIQDTTPRMGSDQPPEPQQVVNQTETETPVARPADETFPNVPQLALSGLIDKIDQAPERRTFPMEDPNPTKPVDTKSQSTYGASSPGYEFQTMGSWTSLTPNFSYRR